MRVGEHSNSAFGLAMALDYTRFTTEILLQCVHDDKNYNADIFYLISNRTSAVADSMADYLGNVEAAIVDNSTNFYGDSISPPILSKHIILHISAQALPAGLPQ